MTHYPHEFTHTTEASARAFAEIWTIKTGILYEARQFGNGWVVVKVR